MSAQAGDADVVRYPTWICGDCGNKYGRGWPKGHVGTFHSGDCGICGRLACVTEPRDFGHLRDDWRHLLRAELPKTATEGG